MSGTFISEGFSYGYEILFMLGICWLMGLWPVVSRAWRRRYDPSGMPVWWRKPNKSKMVATTSKRQQQSVKIASYTHRDTAAHNEGVAREAGRRNSTANNRHPRPKIHECRQEILLCLERRQITRAVNMLRWIERNKLEDQLRDEMFFMAFLQASCRVGMVDVTDRLFHLMAQNGSGHSMTAEFWHHIFKIMSSRRVFFCVNFIILNTVGHLYIFIFSQTQSVLLLQKKLRS